MLVSQRASNPFSGPFSSVPTDSFRGMPKAPTRLRPLVCCVIILVSLVLFQFCIGESLQFLHVSPCTLFRELAGLSSRLPALSCLFYCKLLNMSKNHPRATVQQCNIVVVVFLFPFLLALWSHMSGSEFGVCRVFVACFPLFDCTLVKHVQNSSCGIHCCFLVLSQIAPWSVVWEAFSVTGLFAKLFC